MPQPRPQQQTPQPQSVPPQPTSSTQVIPHLPDHDYCAPSRMTTTQAVGHAAAVYQPSYMCTPAQSSHNMMPTIMMINNKNGAASYVSNRMLNNGGASYVSNRMLQ